MLATDAEGTIENNSNYIFNLKILGLFQVIVVNNKSQVILIAK